MTRFTDIDLSRLPTLPLGTATYDGLKAEWLAELTARLVANGFTYDVAMLRTDPLVIAMAEIGAGRELLSLTRRDDGIRANLLSASWGPWLDHLGASQLPPVKRLPAVAEPRDFLLFPEDWEADDDFRRRIQLAPESLSAAGPEGAYVSGALAVAGVAAAAAYGPQSFGGRPAQPFTGLGEAHVVIVAAAGDGTASAGLVAAVQAELRQEDRYPLADFITVRAAQMVPYRIEAVLKVGGGADRSLVEAEALKRLTAYAASRRRPGASALRRMLYAAAGVADAQGVNLVEDVDLIAPAADVNAEPIGPATPICAYRAPVCTGIAVRSEVVDD